MYKLFLSLRYLWRRPIGLVAMIGMTLCVAMVLIVISVMSGFLNTVERHARGMLGDVIIDAPNAGGMGHYEEFMDELRKDPDVVAVTPVIYSYGLLRMDNAYTPTVRVVGVRLPEATAVTTIGPGLYPQAKQEDPSFDPPATVGGRPLDMGMINRSIDELAAAIARIQEDIDAEYARPLDQQDPQRIARMQEQLVAFEGEMARLRDFRRRPDRPGMLIGVDLPGYSDRAPLTGEYTRGLKPGHPLELTVLPIGRGRFTSFTQPVKTPFTLAGDVRMGIYQVDSSFVYVDFDLLQNLIDMGEKPGVDGGPADPARASQILIKARPGMSDGDLGKLAERAQAAWGRVADRHPGSPGVDADVQSRSWRDKQAAYIGPIEAQRSMVAVMFGVISFVAVVLVFAIFYMLVVQKTRDIGILKSIGGSDFGVAQIFLLYGAVIGLVGSILGVILGSLFVWRINEIHDWVARTFGFVAFDRRAYLFDRIPSEVQPAVIFWVVVAAMIAGVVGAIAPAVRAAWMQPVEALRYE